MGNMCNQHAGINEAIISLFFFFFWWAFISCIYYAKESRGSVK